MHTAQHLVKNALTGELAKSRTILLVTHHISLCLPYAAYLVELSAGKISRRGTIQELRDGGILQQVIDDEDVEVEQRKEEVMPTITDVGNEADLNGPSAKVNGKPARKPTDGKLVQAEARAEGRVSMHSYATYIRAAGVVCSVFTIWLLIQIRLINIGVQVGRLVIQTELSLTVASSSILLDGVKHTRHLSSLALHSVSIPVSGNICHLLTKTSSRGY